MSTSEIERRTCFFPSYKAKELAIFHWISYAVYVLMTLDNEAGVFKKEKSCLVILYHFANRHKFDISSNQ